jgi:prefoldin subunit 5
MNYAALTQGGERERQNDAVNQLRRQADDFAAQASKWRARAGELAEALEKIEKFGHSEGHGRGYTCANWAAEALMGWDE